MHVRLSLTLVPFAIEFEVFTVTRCFKLCFIALFFPLFFCQAELSKFVEEKLLMHKRSARSVHLNGSMKSGGTSLFGGGGTLVLPTSNNAGTIFKVF